MPELFRSYGELLQDKEDGVTLVFAALIAVVVLLLATLTIGALIEAAVCAWKRSRDREFGDGPAEQRRTT